ncbi:hypothetical protein H4R19_006969, partial [Coemansia spiralis]
LNPVACPIVFPLSNPDTKAECTFEEAMRCTGNRVLFASGTAFPNYTVPETGEVKVPGQGNNMYAFPAIGLGATLCKPERITDTMLFAVAKALANSLNEQERACGELYPRIERLRNVAAGLAAAFITQAVCEGLAQDQHWVDVVKSTMAEENMSKTAVTGKYSKRVLGEVKTLMWSPASSVEQYIVEAVATVNPDDI